MAARVLSLNIKDKSALYAATCPMSKAADLHPSTKPYKLGDEVFILLTSWTARKRSVAGQVIWVTPVGAQGRRASGIGIQFSDKDSGIARNKIEYSPYLPRAATHHVGRCQASARAAVVQ